MARMHHPSGYFSVGYRNQKHIYIYFYTNTYIYIYGQHVVLVSFMDKKQNAEVNFQFEEIMRFMQKHQQMFQTAI